MSMTNPDNQLGNESLADEVLSDDLESSRIVEAGERGAPGDAADRGEAQDEGHDDDDESRDEGDIAADFLEELLDISDIDGDLEIEERDGRMYVSVTAEGSTSLEKLASPEVVEALQQVTRLAVQAETGEFSRLILDIGGSRDARKRELAQLVDRAIERLEAGAGSAALPPMSSYERKIVHDIAAERGFVSESEGEGRDRHTVLRAQK